MCACVRARACVRVCVYVRVCAYVYTCVYACVCAFVCDMLAYILFYDVFTQSVGFHGDTRIPVIYSQLSTKGAMTSAVEREVYLHACHCVHACAWKYKCTRVYTLYV